METYTLLKRFKTYLQEWYAKQDKLKVSLFLWGLLIVLLVYPFVNEPFRGWFNENSEFIYFAWFVMFLLSRINRVINWIERNAKN